MDDQVLLLQDALKRARLAPLDFGPLDITVSRVHGDSTVTLRAQFGADDEGAAAQLSPATQSAGTTSAPLTAATLQAQESGMTATASSGAGQPPGGAPSRFAAGFQARRASHHSSEGGGHEVGTGMARMYTTNSFYDDEEQVPTLLAEIERLKRKALSRGVNLTSPNEDVPAEDVATLRQVFSIADETTSGQINVGQLGQLHAVLGEPLTPDELASAFKAMDANRSGTVSFEDFLAWYTLAHSSSGILSRKGSAYTARFIKIMSGLATAFDTKNLTTAATGEPNSLEYRVAFHYNDCGQARAQPLYKMGVTPGRGTTDREGRY